MSKLNIQDRTSPKQHYQNDKALMVVDCNDADIDKVIAQESHSNKTYSLANINKICSFCKLRIKSKRYCKAMLDILKYTICNHNSRIL